jgi:hypothetical protein
MYVKLSRLDSAIKTMGQCTTKRVQKKDQNHIRHKLKIEDSS